MTEALIRHDDWGRNHKIKMVTDMGQPYYETQSTAEAFAAAMDKFFTKETSKERRKRKKREYYRRKKMLQLCH